jgi:O-antigen biosynthesis protein
MTAITIYTCAMGNYDWIHRPRVAPPGIGFLRFSDRSPLLPTGWMHRPPPPVPQARSARSTARYAKVCPHAVLPDCDIAIWIDSSVEVLGDVTPLVRSFIDSGADVALFPHPSGRTVTAEIDFAIMAGRIRPEAYDTAERQRQRYAEAGVADEKVVESTIIFYRLSSDALRAAGEAWWAEIVTYTERDQVSQPFAMRDEALKVHYWDWHFDDPNPYFRRLPHRPKALVQRVKTGAHFLAESRLDYRIARYAISAGGRLRRAGLSLLALPK